MQPQFGQQGPYQTQSVNPPSTQGQQFIQTPQPGGLQVQMHSAGPMNHQVNNPMQDSPQMGPNGQPAGQPLGYPYGQQMPPPGYVQGPMMGPQAQQNPYQGQPVYSQPPHQYITPTVGNPMEDDDKPLHQNNIGITMDKYSQVPTSRAPQQLQCNQCKQIILSRTVYQPGTGSWVIGCTLFWCAMWPCCWLPCCIDDCKDVHHFCPKCQNQLGVTKYLFD